MTNTAVMKINHNNHVVTETKAKQPTKPLLLWGNHPTRTDRGLSQLGIQLNPLVKRHTNGKEVAAPLRIHEPGYQGSHSEEGQTEV